MQANEREQKQSSFPAVHCKDGCSALQERLQCTVGKGYIMADERPILWRTALQAAFVVCYLYRGRCPRLLIVVPSRHQSARGVLVMRLPSRHRSACGVLVMRLPILIGHDVAHRYKKSSPRWEDCLYHCSRYSKRETSLLNDYAKLLMCFAKLDFRFAALFL